MRRCCYFLAVARSLFCLALVDQSVAVPRFGIVLHLLLFVTIIWSCFSNQCGPQGMLGTSNLLVVNLLCLWSSFATATGTCIIKFPNVSNSPGSKARHGKRSPARFVAPRIYHCSAFCSWTKKARSFQSHYFRSIRSMPESNPEKILEKLLNYCQLLPIIAFMLPG